MSVWKWLFGFPAPRPLPSEPEPKAPQESIYDSLIEDLEQRIEEQAGMVDSYHDRAVYYRRHEEVSLATLQRMHEQLAVLEAHRAEELAEPPFDDEQRKAVNPQYPLSDVGSWSRETQQAFAHLRAVGALHVD